MPDDAPLLIDVFPDLIRALDSRLSHLVELARTPFGSRQAIQRIRLGLAELRLYQRVWTGAGQYRLLLCGQRDWGDSAVPARLNLDDISVEVAGDRIVAIDLTHHDALARTLDLIMPVPPPPNTLIIGHQPRLVDALPRMSAAILEGLWDPPPWLIDQEKIDSLLRQIDDLFVYGRCCAGGGSLYCASVYTAPKPLPGRSLGIVHTTPLLSSELLLRHVDGNIVQVESLGNRYLQAEVDRLFTVHTDARPGLFLL